MNQNNMIVIAVIFCVLIMSLGQILFKYVAVSYNSSGVINFSVFGGGAIAITLYAISTVLWIWVLRYMDLSKAYPFFAISFVIVPLSGMVLYGDSLSMKNIFGLLFIVLGIILSSL